MKAVPPTNIRSAPRVETVVPTQDQAARLRQVMASFRQDVVTPLDRAGGVYYTPTVLPLVRHAQTPGTLPSAEAPVAAQVRGAAGSADHPVGAPRACNLPVIAVTSGKGGVGKTSIAVNLAASLAQSSVRVTLLDADLGLANADVMCGLSPINRLDSLVEEGDRRRTIRQICVDAPGGFRLVPGAVGLTRMANLDAGDRFALLDALADLERENDMLLIDTGAGVGDGVISFVRHADVAIVVVTPEPTSIADAYALIKVLRASQDDDDATEVRLLVNQVRSEDEARRVHARIATTSKRFLGLEPELLGWMRFDESMHDAVRARGPVVVLHPRSGVASDINRVALDVARIMRVAAHPSKTRSGRNFFARLLSRD